MLSPTLGVLMTAAGASSILPPGGDQAKAALESTPRHAGAGHGFLRDQSGREGANLRATEQAWPRVVAFLRKHLE